MTVFDLLKETLVEARARMKAVTLTTDEATELERECVMLRETIRNAAPPGTTVRHLAGYAETYYEGSIFQARMALALWCVKGTLPKLPDNCPTPERAANELANAFISSADVTTFLAWAFGDQPR